MDSKKKTPARIEFVDIAGLVKGASKGKGKGNAFLSHIREVDLIVHVVRCFDDPDVVHVEGFINPRRDIRTIEDELILKDLESVEKRLSALKTQAKGGEKEIIKQRDAVDALKNHLETGEAARSFEAWNETPDYFKGLFLLSRKPVLYACNVSEEDIESGNEWSEAVREIAAPYNDEVVLFAQNRVGDCRTRS